MNEEKETNSVIFDNVIIGEHEVYKTKDVNKYSQFLNRPELELLDENDFIIHFSSEDMLESKENNL
jgi:hypothetical protein